jgi:hypothetical protein
MFLGLLKDPPPSPGDPEAAAFLVAVGLVRVADGRVEVQPEAVLRRRLLLQ